MNKKTMVATLLLALGTGSAMAETVPGKQAATNGFNTCQAKVEQIAEYLIDGAEHGALSTWNSKDPDSRMFNSQLVLKYTDGNSVSMINVAPVKGGKCDGSYTSIFNLNESCSVLRETTFKEWKFYGEVGGLVSLENDTGAVSVLLLPAAQGCTAIKTEVVY